MHMRAGHDHIVGELELSFERPGGDAAMQELPLGLLLAATRHHQQVGLRGDLDVLAREPRHGQPQAIGVLVMLFEVEGRESLDVVLARVFQKIEEMVETDPGRTVRGQVDGAPHIHVLL
jgi:hypothetical protein